MQGYMWLAWKHINRVSLRGFCVCPCEPWVMGVGGRGSTQTARHRFSLFLGPWGKTWELEEEGRGRWGS